MSEPTTPPTPKTGEEPGVTPPTGAGTGDAPPPAEPGKFTQADIDRAVQNRLAEEKTRQAKAAATEKAAAETKRLEEQGEWKKLHETAQAEAVRLQAELDAERIAVLRGTAGAKHGLPPELTERLRGTTADELDADAKVVAKLVTTRAPDQEQGARPPRTPAAKQDDEVKAQLSTGRYGF